MKYHEILKALIGIPSLSARLDNPFPLVGDKVTISSTSEWVRQHEYLLDGGAGPERSVLDCVLGKSSETVDMSPQGSSYRASVYPTIAATLLSGKSHIRCFPPPSPILWLPPLR